MLPKRTAAAILAFLMMFSLGFTVFTAPTEKGDVDGDGTVSSADARLALRRSVALEELTPRQLAAASVTGGAAVTPADARVILRMAVGLTSYDAEREESVEKALAAMSLREKIEQMIMPDMRYYDGLPQETLNGSVAAMLEKHAFAGVILFAQNTKTAEQTLRLTDALQTANRREGRAQLLIAVDQEGGKITRLATGTQTPGNMALGAIGEGSAAREAAGIIGKELRSLGINVDLAPVMDVNSEPANPVIGVRSFSDRPEVAARLGAAYLCGLQDQNVIAAMKHFPGHGDTGVDSHTGLPSIGKTSEELKKNELIPFAAGIAAGAEMIMTAHIQYPEIEKTTRVSQSTGAAVTLPATLSEKLITGLLRGEMGFDGVVITDSMKMGAIADHFDPLDAASLAVNAGADILLTPFSLHSDRELAEAEDFIAGLTERAENGTVSRQKIDDAVRRILRLKYDKGLFGPYILPENAAAEAKATVGCAAHHEAEWALAKRAVAMVKNDGGTLPVRAENKTIALLAASPNEVLSLRYGAERAVREGTLPADADLIFDCCQDTPLPALLEEIDGADYVIAVSELYRESGLDPRTGAGAATAALDRIIGAVHSHGGRFVLISAHLPYDAARFQAADAILLCWSDMGMNEDPRVKGGDTAQYGPNIPAAVFLALSGTESPQGKLPVDVPGLTPAYTYSEEILYPFGFGLTYGDGT